MFRREPYRASDKRLSLGERAPIFKFFPKMRTVFSSRRRLASERFKTNTTVFRSRVWLVRPASDFETVSDKATSRFWQCSGRSRNVSLKRRTTVFGKRTKKLPGVYFIMRRHERFENFSKRNPTMKNCSNFSRLFKQRMFARVTRVALNTGVSEREWANFRRDPSLKSGSP